jgi:hypothetical protein
MKKQVFRTENHDIFRYLDGNRSVEQKRVAKIRESIRQHGYIFNPIICNEHLEIIDGQGRVQALRELHLPVDYIICPGLTVKDCIVMNAYGSKWTMRDYINSYAERGYTSYTYLSFLLNQYKSIGLTVVASALTGKIEFNNKAIINGEFECTDTQYEYASKKLEYVTMFVPTIEKHNKGSKTIILQALMFAYDMPNTDKDKLLKNFENYYGTDVVSPFVNMRGALQAITDLYNYRSREKTFFEVEYHKFQCSKYNMGYEKRWGKHYKNK